MDSRVALDPFLQPIPGAVLCPPVRHRKNGGYPPTLGPKKEATYPAPGSQDGSAVCERSTG